MKKIIWILLICTAELLILSGCEKLAETSKTVSINSEYCSQGNEVISLVNNVSISNQYESQNDEVIPLVDMNIEKTLYDMVSERMPLLKDDAYFTNLIMQIGTYDKSKIKTVLFDLAVEVNTVMTDVFFNEIDSALSNKYREDFMVFVMSQITSAEYQESIKSSSGDCFFIKEEIFDKYIYSYFNIKFDFSNVRGYSKNQAGVWLSGLGYEYLPEPSIVSFNVDENDTYNLTVKYTQYTDDVGVESQIKTGEYYINQYTFLINGDRIIIVSIKQLENHPLKN